MFRGETHKARERRIQEGWFTKYAPDQLSGIDIGCQYDPLNETFRKWDLIFGDGDATYMAGVPDATFHTVYASHVLEHLYDPVCAIWHWWRILRPGGNLIIVVPHRDLYEGNTTLPSRWNGDHKHFYHPDLDEEPDTRCLRRVINDAIPGANIIEYRVLQDGWSQPAPGQHPPGEYSIEAIVQKASR